MSRCAQRALQWFCHEPQLPRRHLYSDPDPPSAAGAVMTTAHGITLRGTADANVTLKLAQNATTTVDVSGNFVLPGVIQAMVHRAVLTLDAVRRISDGFFHPDGNLAPPRRRRIKLPLIEHAGSQSPSKQRRSTPEYASQRWPRRRRCTTPRTRSPASNSSVCTSWLRIIPVTVRLWHRPHTMPWFICIPCRRRSLMRNLQPVSLQ